jgi:MFS family permease
LLVWTAVAGLLSAAGLTAVVLAHLDSIAVVLGITLVAGLVVALENPVRRAFVSELVGPEDLSNAVGLNAAVLTGSKVVGPAVAGALIAGPGLEWCFLVNALTFAPQIVLFARLDRARFQPSIRVARERGQIRAGLRYAMRRPDLRAALLMTGLASMAYQNMAVLLPVFTERDLRAGPVAFSVMFSVMSAGMIAGSLVVARAGSVDIPWIRHRSFALFLALGLLALSPVTPVAVLVAVLVGAAYVQVSVAANALLQMRIEGDVRGRVLGLLSVVTLGTAPAAAPFLGLVADAVGARVALALAGVIAGLGGVLARLPARRSRVRAGPAAWEPQG